MAEFAGDDVPQAVLTQTPSQVERLFPRLTAAQIERLGAQGKERSLRAGEVLYEPGERRTRIYVLKSGLLEVTRHEAAGEQLVALLGPGMFTGEVNLLSGRPTLARIRVRQAGDAIEVDRDSLLRLLQTDAELSEIFMRSFILRRVELIAQGVSDVVLIGSAHCQGTLRIKEFLTRNGHPYAYVDLDRDEHVQTLLDRFHVAVDDIPVLICEGATVLRNPSNREIADCLGFNIGIEETHLRDMVVVGGGLAGLAAAVYAASEGLDVLVVEESSPG